jgi:VanZ family protein
LKMSVSVRLIILWTVLVVLGTLAPFNFRATPAIHEGSFKAFQFGAYELGPMHFVLNVVLFMPLGVLLHHKIQNRPVTERSSVALVGMVGLLLSLTVEYLQSYLPTRDSSLIDVVANTAGGLLGAFADRTWGPSVEAGVNRMRGRTSPAILAVAIATYMLVALSTTGVLQARTALRNWSEEYPILIGNERTGDRPWRGRVLALTITDAATAPALIRRFAAGGSIALAGSPVATYDFVGNAPYRDETGNLPDLNWTAPAGAPASGFAILTGRPWLQTVGSAALLARRLRQTNRFTFRIQCAAEATDQGGPARIVSNSSSPFLRNFTLGQEGADLVVRLRTPQTGNNGYPLETIVPSVFVTNQPRDIIVTYDGATLLGAVANTERVFRTDLTPAASLAGLVAGVTSHTARTDDLPIYEIVYCGALFLPPGVVIALLTSARRRRLLFGSLYVVLAPVLLEGTLVLVSGRTFDWANVAMFSALSALALLAAISLLSQHDVRRGQERRWSIATENSV